MKHDLIIKKITRVFLVLSAAAVLLPAFGTFPARAGENGISMNIRYGFDNDVKAGRILPVNVSLSNKSSEDLRGTVCITTSETGGVGGRYEYDSEILVKKGSEARKTYYIPLSKSTDRLLVAVKDPEGNIRSSKEIDLKIDRNSARLFMGILSDSPEELTYFDNVSLNYGLLKTRCFYLDAQHFPGNSMGLDQMDVILISDFRIRDLSEAQTRALMDWTRGGGILILGTGERADDTLGRFAPELLDDIYEEPEYTDIEFGIGSDETEAAELPFVEVLLHGGTSVMQSDGLDILTSASLEKGKVLVAGFDFTDISEICFGYPALVSEMLLKGIGNSGIEKIAGELYKDDSGETAARAGEILNFEDENRVPPIGIYALSLVAYILLVGPVLFVFLKQRELGSFYRLGAAALAVVFTVILYLIGSKTRYDGTFYKYASVVDADEDNIRETDYIGLAETAGADYKVELMPEYSVFPIASSENSSFTCISEKENSTELFVRNAGQFASEYFKLEKTGSNTAGVGLFGYISLFGNEAEGELKNAYPFDLENTALIFYGKMIVTGPVKAGETISLDNTRIINIPLSNSDEVGELIFGNDPQKKRLFSFYRDEYMKGYTSDVRAIAFTADCHELPKPVLMVSSGIEGYGLSMITGRLSVDSRNGDRIFKSLLIKEPKVISGNYSVEDNSMRTKEPAVIEYELGFDNDIESVIFEWPDKELFSGVFDGTVSMYNYYLGSYEAIEAGKTIFTREELDRYLPPSNTLTVRYSREGDGSNSDKVSLPMLSIIGKE